MFQKIFSILVFCFCFCGLLVSQENILLKQDRAKIDQERYLYEDQIYGLSKIISEELILASQDEIYFTEMDLLMNQEYQKSIALLNLDERIGETYSQINEVKYGDQKWEKNALIARGDYYYIRNDFTQAAQFYKKAELDKISDDAVIFRLAYSYFVTKDFKSSYKALNLIKNSKSNYYYPANYYYAMNGYFLDDFKAATRSLEIVKDHPDYKKYTPYYLGQLYFAQGEYENLFTQVEPLLDDMNLYKRYALHSIIGQAYIQTGQFRKGLDYLELYERNTEKLTETEFYQIALSYYQLKEYNKASRTFKELSQTFNKYQVSSLYHLADCHLKNDDKQSAKSTFKYLSESNIIPTSQKDLALWNYARLSIETGSSREAINTIKDIPQSSKYFAASRQLLVKELYQSEDYTTAINVLDNLPELDNELKILYQDISLRQAKQFLLDGKRNQAYSKFGMVEKYPIDKSLLGESYFWLAKIDFDSKKHESSNKNLTKFIEIRPTGLPIESSQGMAYYLKAYNHFQLKEYEQATAEFRSATNSLKADQLYYDKTLIQKTLLDIYCRKGDAHVSLREFDEAIESYNEAANLKTTGSDYGLYQKGLIEGLDGLYYDKILSMEEIVEFHKGSSYRDHAILHIGDTYLELDDQSQALEKYQFLVKEYDGRSLLVNEAYLQLGLTSYNLGDADKALQYYKEVLVNKPSQAEKNQALVALKEIYIEDQANPDAYFELAEQEGFEVDAFSKDSLSFTGGKSLFEESKYNKAIKALEKYLKQYPDAAFENEAQYMIGESYLSQKSYSEALKAYDAVIDNGNSGYYKQALEKAAIIAYNHENDFVNSFEYNNKLCQLTLSPSEMKDAQLGALRSAFRISNHNEIIKYSKLITESAQYNNEEKSTSYFYLAKAFINTNRKDQAIPALNNVVRLSKNNQAAEASYMISEIFYDKGQFDIAEKQALETTKRSGNYPFWVSKSLILLSNIYDSKGDYMNAKAALEALIDNYKENPDILSEAKRKLNLIEQKINSANRIKVVDENILELDTIGNGN